MTVFIDLPESAKVLEQEISIFAEFNHLIDRLNQVVKLGVDFYYDNRSVGEDERNGMYFRMEASRQSIMIKRSVERIEMEMEYRQAESYLIKVILNTGLMIRHITDGLKLNEEDLLAMHIVEFDHYVNLFKSSKAIVIHDDSANT
ncbi:hypothetical protein [Viridibacillus arvi]|uniref:hypothetical protein n=1 Tax=Viridibacillus arvi TaxID=263475 RepID=UPI0034CD116A